jgi:TRAP-type C4-dicarboxylate transport system permease small subunit
MDEQSTPPPEPLARVTFVVATLLYLAFCTIFACGVGYMIMALSEVAGPQPASRWSAACALIGLVFQLAGVVGLVMVTNALTPYTGLDQMVMPKWKRSHADH